MRHEVARDLSDAAFEFERVVWPALAPMIGGGEYTSVELASEKATADDLDTLAGIDAWQVIRDEHCVRGIASRVQWDVWYQTFTIRISRDNGTTTELFKRLKAIKNIDKGYLFPHLTIQAYVKKPKRKGELIGCAAVKTIGLYTEAERLMIEVGEDALRSSRQNYGIRRADNATFLWIDWDYLNSIGVNVTPYKPVTKEMMSDDEWWASYDLVTD